MKNWKNLFVRAEDGDDSKSDNSSDSFSFPVTNTGTNNSSNNATPVFNDPSIAEVMQVYENGLESINMPGYDFYEFYKSVTSMGQPTEQTYIMAFQMAKTLDKTITAAKLLKDAEFYISKINEVHSQYVSQGQQKLNGIEEKKKNEKVTLQKEVDEAALRISQLRAELQSLENTVTLKRNTLLKVDETYYPQEKSTKEKLNANDLARKASIDKLNSIKDGIQRSVK